MASNTNYTSITDLLSSFTPVERPTRTHYNPFPEIERMNRSYQYYRYPGDQPHDEAVENEAVEEEAVEEEIAEEEIAEEEIAEEESSNKNKKNLNDIINSQEFNVFLSQNYNKYFTRFNDFSWIENGNSATYINDINDWLSDFELTNSDFPIVTTTEYWGADKFTHNMNLNTISNIINASLDDASPLLRQIYITIWAVNDFLKQPTAPPVRTRARICLPEQPQDQIKVQTKYLPDLSTT